MSRDHTTASRPFKMERAGERKPFKPKPWSHQRELEALKGKKISILYKGEGNWATGLLEEADQFALKIRFDDGNKQSAMTVFKHDLSSYRPG